MKTSLKFFSALCAVLLVAGLAYGQATMSSTTTTAAVGVNDTYVYLTTTGMSAIASNNQVLTRLYMDNEAMDVLTIPVSGQVTVRRATGATRRAAHVSGVTVYFGPPEYFGASDPALGACTSTAQLVLPLVVPSTRTIWDCKGSPATWQVINGPAAYNLGVTALGPATAGNIPIGSAALPFQKLYMGTAATNNMIITPAATAAARTITMPDPLGNANLAYTNPNAALGQMFTNTSLTSPAITTDIHSTAAGTSTLGTALLPFGTTYIGTAATNNFVITPAATAGARVITLADPLGAAQIAYTNPQAGMNQMFTNTSLTSPAITTDIRSTAAGASTIGTALLPFGTMYLGTAATNNFVFTPAATAAARVITIPDPLGAATLAFTNPQAGLGQMFTNTSLTSPAITTDIHSTAAGGSTVGTGALPFESIYIGTAATNNVRIDPAATAAAVVATIDDPGIAAVKLPTVVRGNGTFSAALIAAGACGGVVTVAAAGLAATSTVTASLNAAPDAESKKGLVFWAYPTAGNVNILVCNGTAGALTPAADLVFNWTAILP